MNESRDEGRFWFVALVLMCVGGVVYFFNLGASGFSMSEGHRVAPAWEMLADGDWLMPHMFEQAYMRKPPGMPWAIAAFTWMMGQTEFAARAVSASAMVIAAIASAWFARRWFGMRAAWAAGLGHLLMPWMWESGRAAEIEALNNLGTSLAVWGFVDLLAGERRRRWGTVVLAAAGVMIAALAKGPASLPVILGAPLAACVWAGSGLPLKARAFWSAVAISVAGVAIAAGLILWRVSQETGGIVAQGVNEFLWSTAKAPQILTLPLVFLVCTLPASLALAPALLAREMAPGQMRIARTLALVVFIALGAYTIAGISNPRYTLPAAAVISPLVGFALMAWRVQAMAVAGLKARIAKMLVVFAGPIAGVLLASAVGYGFVNEQKRAASSGRDAGVALGGVVENESLIVANDMVEARPEIFLYAMKEAARQNKRVRVKWLPELSSMSLSELRIAEHVYVLVRTDALSTELDALKRSGVLKQLQLTAHHLKVGRENRAFEGTLFRVRREDGR